ncbi:MAG: hypothetical protein IT258_05925 [Saprospiraceae bacterium]|nr:hypothetical protein [Saprospiraceae bacterium]
MGAIEASKREEMGYKEMVKNLDKLDVTRLEKLRSHIDKVVAFKKSPSKAEREMQLVKEIKRKIPNSLIKYKNSLVSKLKDGSIVDKEKEDLNFTINYLDELNAERIVLMGELAKLREVDILLVAREFNKHNL